MYCKQCYTKEVDNYHGLCRTCAEKDENVQDERKGIMAALKKIEAEKAMININRRTNTKKRIYRIEI